MEEVINRIVFSKILSTTLSAIYKTKMTTFASL